MTAHIVEGPRASVRPADHDHALVADLPREEVARVRDLLLAAEVQPAAVVEFLDLPTEDPGVRVEGSGRRLRREVFAVLLTDVLRAPAHWPDNGRCGFVLTAHVGPALVNFITFRDGR